MRFSDWGCKRAAKERQWALLRFVGPSGFALNPVYSQCLELLTRLTNFAFMTSATPVASALLTEHSRSFLRSRRSLAARFGRAPKVRSVRFAQLKVVRAGASRGVLVFWQKRGCRPLGPTNQKVSCQSETLALSRWSWIPARHSYCVQKPSVRQRVGGSASHGEMVGAIIRRLQICSGKQNVSKSFEAHGAAFRAERKSTKFVPAREKEVCFE